ncbi:hypothetical protein IAQ61_011664 [Plenodomus lingam]|uniref:uncharacterized protein n=1 Tax=Leptosphaeria maculans TaxID=5022 RepID=UPI0033249F24|nr:hypothetical protein IAQ61_011664 [Plenodomus lingam]
MNGEVAAQVHHQTRTTKPYVTGTTSSSWETVSSKDNRSEKWGGGDETFPAPCISLQVYPLIHSAHLCSRFSQEHCICERAQSLRRLA